MNKAIWQPPTRRAFVTMLGLGALALAVVEPRKAVHRVSSATDEPVRPMLWIGHC